MFPYSQEPLTHLSLFSEAYNTIELNLQEALPVFFPYCSILLKFRLDCFVLLGAFRKSYKLMRGYKEETKHMCTLIMRK